MKHPKSHHIHLSSKFEQKPIFHNQKTTYTNSKVSKNHLSTTNNNKLAKQNSWATSYAMAIHSMAFV